MLGIPDLEGIQHILKQHLILLIVEETICVQNVQRYQSCVHIHVHVHVQNVQRYQSCVHIHTHHVYIYMYM